MLSYTECLTEMKATLISRQTDRLKEEREREREREREGERERGREGERERERGGGEGEGERGWIEEGVGVGVAFKRVDKAYI